MATSVYATELLCGDSARAFERLRHEVLELFFTHNFDLVMPPMLEDASGLADLPSSDLRNMMLVASDSTSGDSVYVRADLTAQTAYLDACHARYSADKPARMCYALPALHARPRHILSTREPWYAGAEIYGDASLDTDLEILLLMVSCMHLASKGPFYIGLGHAGIYPQLFSASALPLSVAEKLRAAIARKSLDDIKSLTRTARDSFQVMFCALAELYGGVEIIDKALHVFADAPSEINKALKDLQTISDRLQGTNKDIQLCLDLGDLAGFHYHTGTVFSVYCAGSGEALAYGGRCDGVGAGFGRDRAAVGFSTDLRLLTSLSQTR